MVVREESTVLVDVERRRPSGFAVLVVSAVAAILLGVSPFWVNLLASIALLARVVMLVIHLRGIGKPHSGVRSVAYVVGWACMFILGLIALVAAF